MRKIFATILFLLASLTLQATNYYVAKNGNNNNPGTLASPWLTINRSVYMSSLLPGDNVYVRTGTYNERLYLYLIAGTAANPITIQNYPGEYPIIDGTGVTVSGSEALVMIYGNYLHFKGFDIRNVNPGGGIMSQGQYDVISYCNLYDLWGSAIGIGGGSGGGNYNIVEYCNATRVAMSNENGVMSVSWGAGISARRYPNYVTIRHCIVSETWGEGISIFEGTNCIIEDCTVFNIFSVAFYVSDATDNLVQRNFAYMTHSMAWGPQVGFGHWNEIIAPPYVNARNTFINNVAYNCGRNFYSTDLVNCVVANNTFINSFYETCVRISSNHISSTFKNNIVVQEGGLPCVYFPEDVDLIFSNNLYNKSYVTSAAGTGDVISTLNIAKIGATTAVATYYKLVSTSPARNGGVDVNVDYDYLEVARDVNPDIGALEFVVSVPVVQPTVVYTNAVTTGTISAVTGGNVVDDGGGTVSAKGVAYGTSINPTIAGTHTVNGNGIGAFISNIYGLLPATNYHVRAYATNEAGTYYGSDILFTTDTEYGLDGDFIFDERDGKAIFDAIEDKILVK